MDFNQNSLWFMCIPISITLQSAHLALTHKMPLPFTHKYLAATVECTRAADPCELDLHPEMLELPKKSQDRGVFDRRRSFKNNVGIRSTIWVINASELLSPPSHPPYPLVRQGKTTCKLKSKLTLMTWLYESTKKVALLHLFSQVFASIILAFPSFDTLK